MAPRRRRQRRRHGSVCQRRRPLQQPGRRLDSGNGRRRRHRLCGQPRFTLWRFRCERVRRAGCRCGAVQRPLCAAKRRGCGVDGRPLRVAERGAHHGRRRCGLQSTCRGRRRCAVDGRPLRIAERGIHRGRRRYALQSACRKRVGVSASCHSERHGTGSGRQFVRAAGRLLRSADWQHERPARLSTRQHQRLFAAGEHRQPERPVGSADHFARHTGQLFAIVAWPGNVDAVIGKASVGWRFDCHPIVFSWMRRKADGLTSELARPALLSAARRSGPPARSALAR